MKREFVDKAVESVTAAQGSIQNLLNTEGSITDIAQVPLGIVSKCNELWDLLEVWRTRLLAEGGE